MDTDEMVDVYNRINILKSDIRDKLSNGNVISDSLGSNLDDATNIVLNVFIDWLKDYTEEIKFKAGSFAL